MFLELRLAYLLRVLFSTKLILLNWFGVVFVRFLHINILFLCLHSSHLKRTPQFKYAIYMLEFKPPDQVVRGRALGGDHIMKVHLHGCMSALIKLFERISLSLYFSLSTSFTMKGHRERVFYEEQSFNSHQICRHLDLDTSSLRSIL